MQPTPSTSASPSRFAPDGPSPSKRRKLATPGPPLNRSRSSSISTTRAQVDAGLRASSMRVLNVWSSLEDKYTRRLDEDDIVDLRSGDLVRDRGVLSSKAGTWDIGCFAGAEPSEGDYCEEESTAPEEEEGDDDDDDDDDEIGGWGSQAEVDPQVKHVPLQELDPEDAEDLRAFLAAEEARKADQGTEDDLSELEEPLGEDRTSYPQDAREFDTGSVIDVEAESALALSDESPDELDGYDDTVGEGALLWEVGSDLLNHCSEPYFSASTSHSRLTASSGANDTPHRPRPRHHPQPGTPHPAAPDPRPPYPRHTSVAPPDPMLHPSHHPHTHGSSIPPDIHSLNPQIVIAQAIQTLSYLAFAGAPPPPTASFAGPSLPAPPLRYASHSNSRTSSPHRMPPPSTPSWSYPAPYYSPSPHPPWIHPQYPYPYPPSLAAHPHASSSSSSTPFTPGSNGPPSSPSEPPRSSPTPSPILGKGKGKGKRVSFSDGEGDMIRASETMTSTRQRRNSNSQRPSAGRRGQDRSASGSGSRLGRAKPKK